MATIYLPTMAANRGDVETTFGLLEKTLKGTRHKPGLEVIGMAKHFKDKEAIAKTTADTVKNIKEIAKGADTAVHGFSGLAVYESGLGDMRTQSGRDLLTAYCDIAEKLGSKYVHVHSGAGHKGTNYTQEQLKDDRRKVRGTLLPFTAEIRGNLFPSAAINYVLGIENLPSPAAGDLSNDSEKVWRDCTESIEDCIEITDGEMNGIQLAMTFDTCHYACDKKGEIDLIAPVKKIGTRLAHVHVSDVEGEFIPGQSVWKEGRIPGEGRIGNEAFKKFFRYIRENHPNVGIEVEVYNDDFKNPKESEESIKRVLNWLN